LPGFPPDTQVRTSLFDPLRKSFSGLGSNSYKTYRQDWREAAAAVGFPLDKLPAAGVCIVSGATRLLQKIYFFLLATPAPV